MRRGFSPSRSRVNEELAKRREHDSPINRESSHRKQGESGVQRLSTSHLRLSSSSLHPTNPSINHWKYFCHYNNAVYQGGMNAYKKHGKGLLLHDDGAAVITEYLHDTPTGHNIIFRDNSIASVLYKNAAEYEIAYKVGRRILKVGFVQGCEEAHGSGVLIDYEALKIYRLSFRKGVLTDKILHLDRKHNQEAFKRNSIAKLMGLKHEQAFSLTFEKPETMQVKVASNQLTVGYLDTEGELHGLAFRTYCENVDVSGTKSLYLKSIQRGYYKHSQLQTYGQKFFSNGNKYIGQFEKGQFHGSGILVCPQEMKWVYGKFYQGKLAQVIDSNSKRYTDKEFQMWTQGLLEIHRRYRERWIDFYIELPDELYLYTLLKQTLKKKVTDVDPDHEETVKEEQYRMSRIQQQFQEGLPGNIERSYVDVQLEKHYSSKQSKGSRIIDTPKISSRVREQPKQRQQVRRREEPPRGKQPIYIDDPIRSSKIQETPVAKLQTKYTPKMFSSNKKEETAEGERNHRQQDPFKIDLKEVPMDPNRKRRQKEAIKTEQSPERKTTKPNKQSPSRQTTKQTLKESQKQTIRQPVRQTTLRYSQEVPTYFDEGIYRRTYLRQLERQRELYRRLEREDEEYINYLRSGISRSPVHRDYYKTPPRFDPASKRYAGRIINKKNFNYQDPSASKQEEYRQIYAPKDSSPTRMTGSSPLRRTANSPYRAYSPSSPESLGNSRSFIENNYKHWR